MVTPPRIGQTFARARQSSSSSSHSTTSSSLGGGFTDIRGATGIAPPPPIRRTSSGGGSSSRGGFSSITGEEQEVTPPGQVVSSKKVSNLQTTQPVAAEPVRKSVLPDTVREAPKPTSQRPISQRLDERLARERPDFLTLRNALNESGLRATERDQRKIDLAVAQFQARRTTGGASLLGGGSALFTVNFPEEQPETPRRVSTSPSELRDVIVPRSVAAPRSSLRQPSGFLEELASSTLLAQPLGLRPAPTPLEREEALRQELRARGVPERRISLEVAGQRSERVAVGLVGGAPVAGRGASFLSGLLRPVSTRVPVALRSGVGARALTTGTGLTLQAGGALSTEEGLNQAARDLSRELNVSVPEAKKIIRGSLELGIQRGIAGEERVTREEGTGRILERQRVAPEIGRESDEFVGIGQRFVVENVPGLVPFLAPESIEAGARASLRQAGIVNPTESQVRATIQSTERVGVFSIVGLIGTEVGSEFVAAGFIGRGTPGLARARTVKQQQRELSRSIVAPTFIAGLGEGASQTVNVELLTRETPRPDRVLTGAAFGGVTSGIFGLATARFVPTGKGGIVQAVGSGLDFPGETAGDILAGPLRRPFGREVAGLRVPILTGSETGSVSAPRRTRRTRTVPSTGRTTTILGIGQVPVDEFGLPVFSEAPERRGRTRGPSPTLSSSINNVRSPVPQPDPFTFGEGRTEAPSESTVESLAQAQTPSLSSVPILTPAGGPFFIPAIPFGEGGRRGRGGRGRVRFINELAIASREFSRDLRFEPLNERFAGRRRRRRR